eukprot:718853-Pelagomonas_calceolata.AAC.4
MKGKKCWRLAAAVQDHSVMPTCPECVNGYQGGLQMQIVIVGGMRPAVSRVEGLQIHSLVGFSEACLALLGLKAQDGSSEGTFGTPGFQHGGPLQPVSPSRLNPLARPWGSDQDPQDQDSAKQLEAQRLGIDYASSKTEDLKMFYALQVFHETDSRMPKVRRRNLPISWRLSLAGAGHWPRVE